MSDKYKFHMRLPRDGREFPLFLLIVSVISVNIIAPVIAMYNTESSVATWLDVLKMLPILWLVVVIMVVITNKPARLIANKIISPTDSFNAHIMAELLCNVMLMSFVMTLLMNLVLGGASNLSDAFVHQWPRNFAIAFAVEALLAHPVAHFVMHNYHTRKDQKAVS